MRIKAFGVTALIILVFICSSYVFASELITGTFRYMPGFSEMEEDEYFYSDDYFSGSRFDNHFITMSCSLAYSTFEIENDSNIRKLFNEIGFEDIETEDMTSRPTVSSVGTAIAHKNIGEKNVVAVSVRGNKYGAEWASNFIVGEDGNAKGFDDASKKVIERIKTYISDYELEDVLLWIVGFSRSGSIVDLTGVYINNHLDEFGITADDLYVYIFESPACCADDTIYDNIIIVEDENDVIPFLYPKEWGLYTNGIKVRIDNAQTIKTYKIDSSTSECKECTINDYLNDFVSWIAKIVSRKVYSENFERPISGIFEIIFNRSEDDDKNPFMKFYNDNLRELFENTISNSDFIIKIMEALEQNSDSLCQSLCDSFAGSREDVIVYHATTLYKNALRILENHFPQNIFENLKERDSYYTMLSCLNDVYEA